MEKLCAELAGPLVIKNAAGLVLGAAVNLAGGAANAALKGYALRCFTRVLERS